MEIDQVSATIFRLPRDLWHCGLQNFRWDDVQLATASETTAKISKGGLQKAIYAFLEKLDKDRSRPPHLILSGPPGIGKSHLSAACYRWAAARFGTQRCMWLDVSDFCSEVKRLYSMVDGERAYDPFESVEDANTLLVCDDLFGRDLSIHEASQVLHRLINTAYNNQAALLITLNQADSELAVRLPAHEVSRVLTNPTIIRMQAKDHRRST